MICRMRHKRHIKCAESGFDFSIRAKLASSFQPPATLKNPCKLSIYIHYVVVSIIIIIWVSYNCLIKFKTKMKQCLLFRNSKPHNACQKCWFVNTFNTYLHRVIMYNFTLSCCIVEARNIHFLFASVSVWEEVHVENLYFAIILFITIIIIIMCVCVCVQWVFNVNLY